MNREPLTPERWRQLQDLFEAALGKPAANREAFVDSQCGHDPELRAHLVSLLTAHAQDGFNAELLPTQWLGPLAREDSFFIAGERVAGRYVIRRLIGQGGMGEVYEAWDEDLSIPVALKKLRVQGTTEHALQHLKVEGLLARSVSHPNVCRTYDLGRHGEGHRTVWFLTMELLRGETLAERLRKEGRLPPDRVLALATQMATGLGAAHRAGVTHCDFKPGNVMLVPGDQGEQVVVTDFGIARAMGGRAIASRTAEVAETAIMGTPIYMAPEQLSEGSIGSQTDIYALGVVLYEMLTGAVPFVSSSPVDLAQEKLTQAPSPRSRMPDLDARWEKVIRRCMAPDPMQRFDRAGDAALALAGHESGDGHDDRTAARDHLPEETDPFVGRESEIASLARRFADGSHLVVLLGTAGIGKTRLAVRYGRQSVGAWPGKVWFCDLTEARTLEGIASAVAHGLGVPLGPDDSIAHLGNIIASRGNCLMILDNCEQIHELAASAISRWRDIAPGAAFLITTRERLHLPGESVQKLDPLSPQEAMELFTTRARWLRPGLQLQGAEGKAAQEAVRLVEGLPLAIELAAARMRMMSATHLVTQMQRRFRLLTGGPGNRHETLSAAIDVSWDTLSPAERTAWTQCSIFEGGFTLEAAEAVVDLGGFPGTPWVVDVIQSLVDKSLLRTWVGSRAGGGDVRFGMFVSLQEYAQTRLHEVSSSSTTGEAGSPQATAVRHGHWCAQFGTDAALEALDGPGGIALRRRLEREAENLIVACRRAMARNDAKTAAATYRASSAVLELKGPYLTAVQLGHEVLEHASEPLLRAATLTTLANMERLSGRIDSAHAHLDAALEIRRSLGPRGSEGSVLALLGGMLQEAGAQDQAAAHYEAALTIARETDDRRLEGNTLGSLGTLLAAQGRMDAAEPLLDQALAIHRELGNRRYEANVLFNLGNLRSDQGHMDAARAYFEEALTICGELGHRKLETSLHLGLAALFFTMEQSGEARAHYEAGLTISRELGHRRFEGLARTGLGVVLHADGELEHAEVELQAALEILRQIGDRHGASDVLGLLGELFLRQGRLVDSESVLVQGEDLLRSIENRVALSKILCIRGELEIQKHNPTAARRYLREAESLAQQVGSGPDSNVGRMLSHLRGLLATADSLSKT